MPTIPYEVVDVFTASRFGGNPLAVIPDARDLEATSMQRIAAEFGYSETTFVLPPADTRHTAQVRIFTPVAEVPFAGHPNVGTAYVLARRGTVFGALVGAEMWFEQRAGLVPVTISSRAGQVTGASITAPRALEIGPDVPVGLVAACASLPSGEIELETHLPLLLSVGLPFVFAEVTSRAALARARANRERFAEANLAVPVEGGLALFLYVPVPGTAWRLSARMFAPLDNVAEDPATGSAAAALAAYLASQLPELDADVTLDIEQGVDMGRPSQLHLAVDKAHGLVQRVSVGGDCVPVMRGELLL